jgi:hypothetical protein
VAQAVIVEDSWQCEHGEKRVASCGVGGARNYVFDLIGMADKISTNVEEAQTDNVAVFTRDSGHEGQGITSHWTAQAVEKSLFGTWGDNSVWGHDQGKRGKTKPENVTRKMAS